MIICLDYDGTYTKDSILWTAFIKMCEVHNHDVICLTMRYPNEIINDLPQKVKVYYTSREAKYYWAKKNKIKVDIWIDDKPGWLFDNAPDKL